MWQNGEDEKARQIFSALLTDPKTRENGLRSLALLDLYHGRYTGARRRFQDALLLDESPPAAAQHRASAFVAGYHRGGQGDTSEELRQLDLAAAQIKSLGPKVVFGAFVGSGIRTCKCTAKAEEIEYLIAPMVDSNSAEQTGYLHLLQGEIALAEGHSAQAIDLLTLADHDNRHLFFRRSLGACIPKIRSDRSGNSLYEKLISQPLRSLSWEPQQRWVVAHYTLADDYVARGERDKANQILGTLLAMWKDADSDLPLRKEALGLHARIS